MPLELKVIIKNCTECRYIGHSGSFTKGGAKPICDGPNVVNIIKFHKPHLRDDDPNDPNTDDSKQAYHWKHRVIPYRRVESDLKGYAGSPMTDCVPKKIPPWCPLKNGESY